MARNESKMQGVGWILLSVLMLANLIAALLIILLVKSLWIDVNRFLVNVLSLGLNWVAIIIVATTVLIVNYAWMLGRQVRFLRNQIEIKIGLLQKIFILPVFLFWNGMIFVLFTEASDAILVAQLTYYFDLISGTILLILFHAFMFYSFYLYRSKDVRNKGVKLRVFGFITVVLMLSAMFQLFFPKSEEAQPIREIAEGQRFDEQILFDGVADEQYITFRIPGLVITQSGVVIAYAEAREGYSDWDNIDVVMKRSLDGGDIWEPRELLFNSDEETVNNPVMIAENHSETVHFVYNVDYRRAFYQKSTDAGKTWTPARDITSTFESFRSVYDWNVIAFGPGHGIQLKNGRLLVPVWLSPGGGGDGHHPQHVATVYSDDGGKSWLAGEMVSVLGTPSFGEPVAVELSDGSIMLNMRNEDFSQGQVYRAITTSEDGAASWTKPELDRLLPDAVCFGSLHRYDEKTILFSNIHTDLITDFRVTLFGMRGAREPLGIRVSYDDGKSWPVARIYQQKEAGYSDIFVRDDVIYSLYEQGWRKNNKYRTKHLKLVRFNLEWVKNN